ncbi:tRNA glutamyl-Q(34) synthetase GluQRS [Utexia brackfieldae]|uniref:tRNA glutamyl-Q(34) synthetase GluQRS n=1 Tax=Utexia brackfieldae TaxID=3074108 RepID=UPI00370DB326
MSYIGRFAPSPSGDLHFGSLITALASYLQAKSKAGLWLVRIEDIDPPREVAGAASRILRTLEQFGLYWDKTVLYQSQCYHRYAQILSQLLQEKQAYYCDCNRQRIHTLNHIYDNHCANRALSPQQTEQKLAIRLRLSSPITQFVDNIRGLQHIDDVVAREDFILRRRDGLFAYNLAVVLDDNYQGVTEIVRGADLLTATSWQQALYHQLGWHIPSYLHLPLALNPDGSKLSKQNRATPIANTHTRQTTIAGLKFLNQPIPKDWQDSSQAQLLDWAITHWDVNLVPTQDIIRQ